MQQATSSSADLAPKSGNFLPAASPQTSFVINLCASTTPVGLVHPSHPQLKRFTFFVSRRREEGRERFRLHMGYFSSQEEAEKLLDAVRDIYPAAWAGVAPGQNLRSRTPGNAPASQPAAAAPAPAPVAAPPSEETAAHSLTNVRAAIDSLRDQPAAPAQPPAAVSTTTPAAASAPAPPAAAAAEPLRGAQVLRLLEDAPAQPASAAAPLAPRTNVAAAAPVTKAAAPAARAASAAALNAPTTAQRAAPQLRSVPAPRPAAHSSGAAQRVAPPMAASGAPARTYAAPPELAAYAVQLLWSVQPIDMSQIPQLAIFAAYTLYGAEGNRDGRRWYGLRLGFFTDAVSAKQVAQYVRSEFKSVSVVPVTQRERSRATAATAKPLPVTAASKSTGHELNFIEDIPTDTAMSGSRPALQIDASGAVVRTPGSGAGAGSPDIDAIISELAKGERAGAARTATRAPGGKRAKLRVAQGTKPVSKRPRHDGPLTLEETLEILGASTLQLDSGRGELLNDASNRDRRLNAVKAQRGSRFGRLMDRLAERFSGS
jgi:hypothetical protein